MNLERNLPLLPAVATGSGDKNVATGLLRGLGNLMIGLKQEHCGDGYFKASKSECFCKRLDRTLF